MPVLSRISAAAALFFTLAAPALAANGQAPGLANKGDAPAPPEPAVTIPAPAPAAPVDKAPDNKGATKKLVRTAPRPARAAVTAPMAVHRVRQAAQRAHARQAAATQPSRRAAARRARAAAPRTPRPKRRSAAATPAHVSPAAAVAGPSPTPHRAVAAPPAAVREKTSETPLTSISQAADNVVEVIPGTVVLALAGLAGLVVLLIGRSLATERRRRKALATSYAVTVEALATAIEAKDHTTGGHIERVRRLGLLLAGQTVPREARDPQMAYGFLLHDIGKLAVPDAILRAPGRLTGEQWALLRRHPEEGVRMLEGIPFLDKALDIVRYHHERWDGGGYPDGLSGEEIPLWARIFSVVDALDAMTAERPYRSARSYAEALEEIRRNAGSQFDPAVVDALERIDPAQVEPLLEPSQQVQPLAELPLPGPLVAA